MLNLEAQVVETAHTPSTIVARDLSENDRTFIELAIKEAYKSSEEDERVHAKVGVVIVKNNEVLGVAHRGEFPGEHAEYIALERKLANCSLVGGTVYTTLEPCSSRNHPKVPCAERMIQRRVTRVVIGTLDPNPEISGKGYHLLRDANITVGLFEDADLVGQIEELNRDFRWEYRPPPGQKKSRSTPPQSPLAATLDGVRVEILSVLARHTPSCDMKVFYKELGELLSAEKKPALEKVAIDLQLHDLIEKKYVEVSEGRRGRSERYAITQKGRAYLVGQLSHNEKV